MPLCRYAHLAIPLYPRSSPFPLTQQLSGGLGHFPSGLEGCPVTHCQLACLFACYDCLSGRYPPLPWLSLCLLCPGLLHAGEDVDPPSFLSSPPYLVLPVSPCMITWSSSDFFGVFSSPSFAFCFFRRRLWLTTFTLDSGWICLMFVRLIPLPFSTPPLPQLCLSFRLITPFLSLSYSHNFSPHPHASPGLTLSALGSVTRVILLLRTYLAGLLQVYMLAGTSIPQPCLFFSNLPLPFVLGYTIVWDFILFFDCDA